MKINVESEQLQGVVILKPESFEDARGFFLESYREDLFRALGLPTDFKQDNHSRSSAGVVRGLHFQYDPPMGKLIRVTRGRGFLVAVDIRKGSPTLGQWVGIESSEENRLQMYAPAGFARGLCALSEVVEIQYKCTALYNQSTDISIRWDDPEIGIRWPIALPQISKRDSLALRLTEWLQRPESDRLSYLSPAAAGQVS